MCFSVGISLLEAYEAGSYGKQKIDGRSLLQNYFYRQKKPNKTNKKQTKKLNVCKLSDIPYFTTEE